MPVALITGITGQDGSYLADLLIEKGYEIHGIVRRSSSFNRWRLEHLIQDPVIYGKTLFLHYADLSDDASLRRIFSKTKPDEFYHLAGQSHVGISFEIPEITTHEIANCTLKLLEICRDQDNPPKVYLACSSEIFGNSSDCAQNENSFLNPTSPYGVAKAFCLHTGHIYKESYQLFVCNGILYNHESPRRGENFVTQKIVHGAASIAKGNSGCMELGNLDIERDWGYAPDYVLGMWLMLQQQTPSDYILASGTTHKLSEFLETAFQYFDLDCKKYVRVNKKFIRPNEPQRLCGDSSKAQKILNWKPSLSFTELIHDMCEAVSNK
jgi:GDPmannose 4,6-dehydratase